MRAVLHCVQLLGADAAQELLREALGIEAAGGQRVPSGNRRRTPGGVFFHLLRARVTPAQYAHIFAHNKEMFRERDRAKNRRRNARRRAEAQAPPTTLPAPLPPWMAALAASPPPRPPAAHTPGSAASSPLGGTAAEEEDLDAQLAALEAELLGE